MTPRESECEKSQEEFKEHRDRCIHREKRKEGEEMQTIYPEESKEDLVNMNWV